MFFEKIIDFEENVFNGNEFDCLYFVNICVRFCG